MNKNILPPNASRAEVAMADAITPTLPVAIRDVWNPLTCPEAFLPYLAQSFSVDRWDASWTEQEKRAAIEAAFFVHRHKGTIAAIRRVVEPLGYLINVMEWWQTQPQGEPHTFALTVGVLDSGISDEMYRQMVALIEDAKPLRSHLTGLAIHAESRGVLSVNAGMYCGDLTTIYPYAPAAVSVSGLMYHSGREHTIDRVNVYPISG
ncbi:phage tail protein I [Vibrio ostreicida]|uniref:Phage tail protein I n=1 Tax=Vibrio ostreicida TaxID=526588 RepID=A0ABT8BZ33_9VIBR|nr:phage tail protein I [Vibrio ostreicida]MDN3611350.1 phage tail protein I [Vibrio ostreicida]NPD09286.1 phage tail protein I [Vibrio ostreicida]